jgi:hypothetical protein
MSVRGNEGCRRLLVEKDISRWVVLRRWKATMSHRTWLIAGVNSGFGCQMIDQLLAREDRVAGTLRKLRGNMVGRGAGMTHLIAL